MNHNPDLLVLGAGPAGIGAALAAAESGLDTVLVDSAGAAGGQIYRPMPEQFKALSNVAKSRETLAGDALRQALIDSKVHLAFGQTVWSIGQNFRVDALGASGATHWQPRALVIANGTSERLTPFPGWTLPGVIGLAAATVLIKSQHMLPGRRTVVAGCGPLLAAVAYGIVRGGGEVAAVLDLASRGEWLATLPALALRPGELARGLGWRQVIHQASVPWLHRHGIREVVGGASGLEVLAAPVDAGGALLGGAKSSNRLRFDADCVTVGHGLIPATEVTRLLGAEHYYDRTLGGWIPLLDEYQRTTQPGLYAAGDGAGVRGGLAAEDAGRVAGYSAAMDQRRMSASHFRRVTGRYRRRLKRTSYFASAMAGLMAQRPGQVNDIAAETVVCRCEDVTRGEIEQALKAGASSIDQLKSWTRCGMGPCQGRNCGDTVAELLARRLGSRQAVGNWTPRVPLRPLDLAALTGSFDYDDIPIPEAAPL